MNTLLLAALFSGWGYGGFTSDPPGRSVVPAATHTNGFEPHPDEPASEPARPPVVPVKPRVEARQAEESRTPARADVFAPTLWRLADASGKLWEHADPDWLRRWVDSRNAALTAGNSPRRFISSPALPSSLICTPSGCYRVR